MMTNHPSNFPADSLSVIRAGDGTQVRVAATSTLTAYCEWPENAAYEMYALVLMKDGQQFTVSAVGSKDYSNSPDADMHEMDRYLNIGGGVVAIASDLMEIRLNNGIASVIIVTYCALEDSVAETDGSVFLEIGNGKGSAITIRPHMSYRNAPKISITGVIHNTSNGFVVVESPQVHLNPIAQKWKSFVSGLFR